MIRFDSVSKAYGGRPLFSNLSFGINKGEKCSLIGRNGSGKTTILKLLSGLETIDGGSIFVPKNYRIGILAQHARWTKDNALDEACTATEAEWKASKMLYDLGFDDELIAAPIATLSGGFSLRLQLAKLLLSEPDLLLLDEPTNYLDIKTVHWLTSFLKKWPGEIISISHDREFLDAISTHTMGLNRGELIRLEGKTSDYFTYVLQKEEQHQKMLEKTQKQKTHLKSFIDRFGAKASKAKQAKSKQKMMDKLPQLEALSHIYNLDFSFRESIIHAEALIKIESIDFAYPEKKQLIEDLSFTITPESRICLAGRNGKGKSTLLKLILGELQPTSGTIKSHPGCKIGYFGQTNIDRLDPNKTIEQEIATASPDMPFERVKAIAGVMMFTQDDSRKKIGVLSGGEKSRVLLAKILATPVNILLLDEPTNHLDIESIEALCEAIEDFQGAVCLVTHSDLLLSRISDSVVIFEDDNVFYFPDNYSVFTETQGWKDESTSPAEKKSKTDRQQRAQTVQDRSRLLSPIKKEIEQLEKVIDSFEIERKTTEKGLLDAFESNNTSSIEQLTRRLKQLDQSIETKFLELETAHNKKIQISV